LKEKLADYPNCISGASSVDDLMVYLTAAGFQGIEIKARNKENNNTRKCVSSGKPEDYLFSATIEAIKPRM